MIISVDTGNKQMKTENCEFNSGVEILDTLPGELEEVIEYEGKYYRTTNRRISYMEDKTADERYFILTLFAIAKELSYQQKYEGMLPKNLEEIELLVGLPPAHYGKQRKKFREYFYRNGTIVEFGYRGIPYRIVFKEVKVYIQAYAAYCLLAVKKQLSVVPKVLLIDIGGFTVDYMVLRFGRLEMEYVDSLENGVIHLYNSIKASIRQKYSILLEEEDIDNIILERGTGYKQELKERVREVAIGYVTELLGRFRELGIDFNTTQTVFLGGGSILTAEFIKIVWKRFGGEYCIINNTKANAKGYRLQYLAEKKQRRGAVSFRAPGQERFTRLRSDTLGDGYGEANIKAALSGSRQHPGQPRQKVSLAIDIQSKLQGKGPGYERWAKVFNLKQMAAALAYLQDNGLTDYEQLEQKATAATERFHKLSDQIKSTEAALHTNMELKAATVQYAKTRPVFEKYKASKYSRKFLAEHEADIELYRAACADFKRILDGGKLPKIDALKEEGRKLAERKKKLYAEYRKAKADMQEVATIKANIDYLLGYSEPGRKKEQER